jgi:MATE family multidrug resistance protein
MNIENTEAHRFSVTHARVFAIAAPMTLANLTPPLLGVVGTAAIGQLGDARLLGAVAISAVVFDCLFWLFGFLRMGTVALTAQALGAGDGIEQRAVLMRALLLAALIGGGIIALQWPLAIAAYAFMGASPAVTAAAKLYFFVRVWSAPFALANYAILGWLVGLARTGSALLLQVLVNTVSIVAISLLVLVLHWGVVGAALGTVIAEATGTVAGLAIALLASRGSLRPPRGAVLDRGKLVRMLTVNRDIMIRTAALITAFALFTAESARSGDTLLAANAVLYNFVLIGAYLLDGFAVAAEQLCGRAIGARDPHAFARAVRLVVAWGLSLALLIAGALAAAGPRLVALMSSSLEVRAAAIAFLPYVVLAPPAGVLAYVFDGIFIGATWTRDMRNLMVASLALYLAALWGLRGLGNAGLWVAILTFLAVRGLLQGLRYPALRRATFAGFAFVSAADGAGACAPGADAAPGRTAACARNRDSAGSRRPVP